MTNIDPPAAPLEAHLGFWLRFVSNHVSARFRQRVEEEGTTVTEWVALRALYDRPLTTHSALIQALGMTKVIASGVRTEDEGLYPVQHGFWKDVMDKGLAAEERAAAQSAPVTA